MAKDPNPNTPMYGSYRSFNNFVEHLRQHPPMPSRIDKSSMAHLNYGTQQALMAGMRFLSLLGEGDVPTGKLEALVDADEAGRPAVMLSLLQRAYPYFWAEGFDLTRATHGQIVEKIRTEGNVSGSTIEKALGFFLAAADAAGVKLSPHVTSRSSTGSGPRTVKKKPIKPKPTTSGVVAEPKPPAEERIEEPVADPWLSKYPDFNPEWSPEIQKNWFEGFARLMELRRGGKE